MTVAVGLPTLLRLIRYCIGEWTLDGVEPGVVRLKLWYPIALTNNAGAFNVSGVIKIREGIMFLKHWFLLFATLLFIVLSVIGLPGNGYAAEQFRVKSGKPSASIKGTWHSAKGTLTFNANDTIIYKGKRYYYAVSNGGTIQLSRKHGTLTIPFQLAGGKLTLTVDGKATVYTRKR